MATVGDVLEWARNQVVSRVPKADLDQRDPDYIRDQLPGTWLLASVYFRADVRGLHRIPKDGPVLLVGNHSGGNVPPDTFVFTLAFCSYFGVGRAPVLPTGPQPRRHRAPRWAFCASSAPSPPTRQRAAG